MEPAFIIGIIFAVAGLVIGIILIVNHFEKKRAEAMEAFASELSLEFHPKDNDLIQSQFSHFGLFNSGHSRKLKNIILGTTDIASIAIFDYQYTTGSGKNQSTHSQTVVAMSSDQLETPSFTLRPENLFDWFGSALGFQDIDFEEHPEFSRLFVLKGENEEAIRKFFDVPLLDFFAARPGITFECTPGSFVYFRGGKRTKPETLRDYLDEGYSVYSAFIERLNR